MSFSTYFFTVKCFRQFYIHCLTFLGRKGHLVNNKPRRKACLTFRIILLLSYHFVRLVFG